MDRNDSCIWKRMGWMDVSNTPRICIKPKVKSKLRPIYVNHVTTKG